MRKTIFGTAPAPVRPHSYAYDVRTCPVSRARRLAFRRIRMGVIVVVAGALTVVAAVALASGPMGSSLPMEAFIVSTLGVLSGMYIAVRGATRAVGYDG